MANNPSLNTIDRLLSDPSVSSTAKVVYFYLYRRKPKDEKYFKIKDTDIEKTLCFGAEQTVKYLRMLKAAGYIDFTRKYNSIDEKGIRVIIFT